MYAPLVFHSVRELLINSAKHAVTGQAILAMEQREENLRITVSDNGKGLDLAAGETPSGGISSKMVCIAIRHGCGRWAGCSISLGRERP